MRTIIFYISTPVKNVYCKESGQDERNSGKATFKELLFKVIHEQEASNLLIFKISQI